MTRPALLAVAALVAGAAGAPADDNELKPAAEIKLNASVSHFVPSPDRKYLYFLNKSDGKVQRIDLDKKKLDDASADAVEGAEFFTASPDGNMIYVCASPNGHSAYSGADKETGKVQAIAASALKTVSTFSMKFDPFEIAADNGGKVYATGGSNQNTKLNVIDVRKKSIVGDLGGVYMGSNLRMTPDGKRLYVSSNDVSPGSAEGVWLDGKGKPTRSSGAASGPFDITPDGKFLIFRSGPVLRVGKSAQDDLKEAGKIKSNRAACVDVKGKTAWAATPEGELLRLSYPDFELEETFILPKPAYQLYLDPESQLLFAALDNSKKERVGPDKGGVGNIAIFELKKKD